MPQAPQTPRESIQHFRVALIEKSPVPPGTEDEGWYRYVLESGYAAITGWRRGSLQEITHHARRCTEDLNARGSTGALPRRGYRRKTSH